MSLTKEQKATWVAALRSGDYEQCRGELKNREGAYCCLGVAHEVLVGPIEYGSIAYAALEPLVGRSLTREDPAGALVYLNDSQGKSFAEIADYVEANL